MEWKCLSRGQLKKQETKGLIDCCSGPSLKNEDYKINHRQAEHPTDMQVMCGEVEEKVSHIVASV